MYAEFNELFKIGKCFESVTTLKATIKSFGGKYNVVFSVEDSHPKRGQFLFICKHGGLKRDTLSTIGDSEKEDIEVIDLTVENGATNQENGETAVKKRYRKNTQKHECPAYIRLSSLTVKAAHPGHDHPIPQDFKTYAIYRKQSPEIMEKIYSILASGHSDPVTSVMDVRLNRALNLTFC